MVRSERARETESQPSDLLLVRAPLHRIDHLRGQEQDLHHPSEQVGASIRREIHTRSAGAVDWSRCADAARGAAAAGAGPPAGLLQRASSSGKPAAGGGRTAEWQTPEAISVPASMCQMVTCRPRGLRKMRGGAWV
jgi:hypothetical protein